MFLCCHADGDTIDYAKEAYEKTNIRTLGMSDHGPLPYQLFQPGLSEEEYALKPFDGKRMTLSDFEGVYTKSIQDAQKAYPEMKILKSIEIEYVPGHLDYYQMLAKNCDYLLLGQHYILDPLTGFGKLDYSDVNYQNIQYYVDTVVEALDTGLFKIIAHPDIFLACYMADNGLKRHIDQAAQNAIEQIVQACVRNNVMIEYNSNGVIRGRYYNTDGTLDYTYPRKEFFEVAKKYNARIVLGIDAHMPVRLHSNHLAKCMENLIELGIVPENIKVI